MTDPRVPPEVPVSQIRARAIVAARRVLPFLAALASMAMALEAGRRW